MDLASRLAIVFRIWVRGVSVYAGPAGPAGADDGVAARAVPPAPDCAPACAKSRATTRPSGPLPLIAPRSIPLSAAIRLASGEAFTRPPAPVGWPLPAGAAIGAGAELLAADSEAWDAGGAGGIDTG